MTVTPEEAQPVSPDEAQDAVKAQLGDVAASVTGNDVVGQPVDVSDAAPAAPDVSELLAAVQAQADQLKALQEKIDAQAATVAAGEAQAKPPNLLEALASSSVGSQAAHLFAIIEERLSALEGHGQSEEPAE